MTKAASPTSSHTFFNLSSNKQHIIALLFLFILPFFLFSGSIGSDKQVGSDTVQWTAADKTLKDYKELHPEKDALWAENSFSGMPGYVISRPYQVPNVDTLLKKISKFLYPVIYFWVLLSGAYLFLILLDVNPFAAAIGAVFIGFTTYIPVIIQAGHVTKFIAYSFIPWVLVGYLLLTQSKSKKLFSFFVFALALAFEARAGHPQVLYYFMYLLLIWWLFDTYKAYKNNEIKPWAITTLMLVSAGILAILSNVDNYWSLYEYTQHSTRGGSALESAGNTGLTLDYAFAWSQGWGELFTLIIPGIFGGSSAEAYWGPKPFTSGPHYFGAIAFLLAIFGLFKSKNRLKYIFLASGILAVLFSLGKFFPLLNEPMFKYVPYFNKFRTPEMWLIVTVTSFAVLAALGLDALIKSAQNSANKLKDIAVPLGIAAAVTVIFMVGSTSVLSFEKEGEIATIAQQNNVSANNPQVRSQIQQLIDQRIKPERIEIAKTDSMRFGILMILGLALIAAFYTGKVKKEFLLIGILVLGAYDLLNVGNRYLQKDNRSGKKADAETIIKSQKRPIDAFLVEHIDSGDGYPYRVLPILDNPFNNAIPTYYYPSLGGYTAAKLSYYQDMLDELLFAGPYGINAPVLSMLNAKYVTSGQEAPLPFFKKVFEGENQFVYENTEVLPKAFFADTLVHAENAKEAMNIFKSLGDFDPTEVAIVETLGNPAASKDSTAAVKVTNYDVQHIKLETQSGSPQFLILSEIYYPEGWKAFVDGVETEIYKTNYVLRGIEVPAGTHNIEFVFEPLSNIWGKRLAWFGTLLIYGIGIIGFISMRKPKDATKSEAAE